MNRINKIILISTLVICIILCIVLYIISDNCNKTACDKTACDKKKSNNLVADLFNNLDTIKNNLTDNQIASGVLVHMFSLEDMTKLNGDNNFKFNLQTQGTADCGGNSLKACSAWTFLRKDIPPIIFTYPTGASIDPKNADDLWKSIVGVDPKTNYAKIGMTGGLTPYWTPNCCVILDAKKAFPLITSMAIIDSGTDERNCLSNGRGENRILKCPEYAWSKTTMWPKNENHKKRGLNEPIGVIQSSNNKGANCPVNCNELYDENTKENMYCKYRVSGGSFSMDNINDPKYSQVINFNENSSLSEVNQTFNISKNNISREIYNDIKDDCDINNPENVITSYYEFNPGENSYLRNPFICKTEKTPLNAKFENDIEFDTFQSKSELNIINNYIGSNDSNGSNIKQNINTNKNNGKTYYEQYIRPQGDNNCPIGIYNIQNTQCKFEKKDFNRFINEHKNFWLEVFKSLKPNNEYQKPNCPPIQNWLSANPGVNSLYFENEVNFFINPNINDDDDKYNKIYRDAIIGFGYFNKTVEEQLYEIPELDNIPITYQSYSGTTNVILNNIRDRVIGKTQGTESVPGYLVGVNNKAPLKYIFEYEKARLQKGQETMRNIKNKFNSKYNRDVSLYELNTYSPILQNYKLLDKVFKGQIDGNEIFIKKN